MAIGLEETDTGVWKLLMAVSIHAVPIVFCVGTDMISSGVKKVKIIVYMIVLSINTPIGILIGILVTIHMENATGQHVLLIGVLQVGVLVRGRDRRRLPRLHGLHLLDRGSA